MPRAYSQDLRDRVIDAVEQEGMSRRAATRRFGVSEASAIKWLQRYHRRGDRACAGTGGHRPSKMKPQRDWLLAAYSSPMHEIDARKAGKGGLLIQSCAACAMRSGRSARKVAAN